MVIGIPFIDRLIAPKMQSKSLPAKRISEKGRVVQSREYSQRPLPNVPIPVQAYVVDPTIIVGQPQPHRHRSTAHRASSSRAPSNQPTKRSRTVSQGAPPLRGILKNKGQINAPPMQASGGFASDYYPQQGSQSWPSASMQHFRSGGYTVSQLDHAGHHPSERDRISRYPYAHVHNGANVAPPLERSRTTHADTTRSRTQYQTSDSPVSDDSDQGNNPPVALLQVRASNYISAYVRPVRMKPEVYHLNWPLKPVKPDKHGIWRLVYFDIAFDPREHNGRKIQIYETGGKRSVTREELCLPATTHCVITDMTIVHSDPRYASWSIRVYRKDGIRCKDVLSAIYETFHQPVRDEDGVPEQEKENSEIFRRKRCEDSSGLFEYNWRQGPLRVDLLRSHRIFAGLEQDNSQWKLLLNSYHHHS